MEKGSLLLVMWSLVAMAMVMSSTEGAPTDAHVRNKRVALANYRKHFDIIGHRVIDEHHEYHDYGPKDYHDYHDDHYDDDHDYHYDEYFDHHDYQDDHDYHGGYMQQQQPKGYGHQQSGYKPKPQIIIIKKIVPLSTTTAP